MDISIKIIHLFVIINYKHSIKHANYVIKVENNNLLKQLVIIRSVLIVLKKWNKNYK